MEFAVPCWENCLTVSELMTPTSETHNHWQDFMLAYLWVAIGGALGSVARFWMSGIIASKFGETFPWGTIIVNVVGSFVIGFLAALNIPEGRWQLAPGARVFLMIGVCGGYTTFSSFSLQTLRLMQEREWLYAGGNILLSMTACLVAVWLGYLLGATFNTLKGS